jgi:tetratricopeptide (TPR) repeat protein
MPDPGPSPAALEEAFVGTAAHELAAVLAAQGRLAQATALYERSLAIKRRVFGPGHTEVAMTLHNLAVLHEAAGRTDDAARLWAEASAALGEPA